MTESLYSHRIDVDDDPKEPPKVLKTWGLPPWNQSSRSLVNKRRFSIMSLDFRSKGIQGADVILKTSMKVSDHGLYVLKVLVT